MMPLIALLTRYHRRAKDHPLITPPQPSQKARDYLVSLAESRCPHLPWDIRKHLVTECGTMTAYWASEFILELKSHRQKWKNQCLPPCYHSSIESPPPVNVLHLLINTAVSGNMTGPTP